MLTLGKDHEPIAKTTPPDLAPEWLPWVHVVIANLKRFILGTYHGVSGEYMQEYIDGFLYRFNRRYWEKQLPRACIEHPTVRLRAT